MRNQWSSPWGGYLLGFLVCALLPTAYAHGADAPQRLEPFLTKNTRLMVFSPHPDDETLAAGGLIQRVLSLGGSVKVVFMTSGDGFPEGVEKENRYSPSHCAGLSQLWKAAQKGSASSASRSGNEEGGCSFFELSGWWATQSPAEALD